MRVLHVSEAMGGGVATSILAMVESTPELDHHLLLSPRDGHDTGSDFARAFSSVTLMPTQPAVASYRLMQLARRLYPDVVHAHSSVAGVVARVTDVGAAAIAYSPHCFAFERRDVTASQRRFFRWVERCLAKRADTLIAVTPYEIDLAAQLGCPEVAYVANRATIPQAPVASWRSPLRIAAVGRVCPQKDWRYLVHLKRYIDADIGVDASWHWLGGGDTEGERTLRAAGINVAGWMPHERMIEQLSQAQVYVHTAAWEAAPMSILEAAQLGLPLVLRSIPPLESLEFPGLESGVAAVAQRLKSLEHESVWQRARADSLSAMRHHRREWQAQQLQAAYNQAVMRAARRRQLLVPQPRTLGSAQRIDNVSPLPLSVAEAGS